jgi:PEP-CTERM motif
VAQAQGCVAAQLNYFPNWEETMQNSSRWSLSLLPCLVALALLPAQFAKADTVFDVSGMAENTSLGSEGSCAAGEICPFSGTLTVNVTAPGTIDGLDITFPSLPVFDTVGDSVAIGSNWEILSPNSNDDELYLEFTTTPTPGSLVGFTGGTIVGVLVFDPNIVEPAYDNFTGTVTPVPEPSSLGLLAVGLLAFVGISRLRKRKPVVTG